MDSVVAPLLTQVKAINTHYDQVVISLASGKPEGPQMLNDLARGIRQLFAHFTGTTNMMKSNVQMASGLQPASMMKMITFYVQEVMAVMQLFIQLMTLITNILSLRTVIDFLMSDLIAAQAYLQTKMLYVEHAVTRAKQKISKNIEWVKRKLTIDISESFTNHQLAYYNAQLDTAKGASTTTASTSNNIQTDPTIAAQQQAAQKAQQAAQKAVIAALTNKVDSLKADMASYPAQRTAIDTDKVYWNALWDKQAKADQALLQTAPQVGANT